MQKISSYIYKNKIQVVSDTGYFSTEWRIVYQRTIKIYKGIDNVIEFDVKNGQQRRMDISHLVMKMVIMDELDQEVRTIDVTPIATKGFATCTISENMLSYVKPQLLKYSLYVVNQDGTKSPMYSDAQYGMIGRIELINGAIPEKLEPIIINTFTFLQDDSAFPIILNHYYSEAAEINPPNDYVTAQHINLDFIVDNLEADISVQITDYAVISTATDWTTIENFSVAPSTTRVYKQYNNIIDYSNNVGWLRVKYTPKNNSTGKIEKIIITL
jgi:hypothetical protein